MKKYDLIIIGAGPGGYEAAASAGKKGLRTLLIEKNKLGGTCLNSGCIPTKTLLAAAHLYQEVKNSGKFFPIRTENTTIDYPKLIERKDRTVLRLCKGIENLIKASKVEVIFGLAVLQPGKIVAVNDQNYQAENIIIAAGGEPLDLPGLKTDNQRIYNSTQILNQKQLPQSLVIIGGGVIGLEFADIFSSLGVEVSIVEILPEILSGEDQDGIAIIIKALEGKGVKFYLNNKIQSIEEKQVILAGGEKINGEKILVSIGRKINNEFIQDKSIKIGDKGEVLVNEYMETSVPGIFAIGDINGLSLYAHAATYQGLKVVENIKNNPKKPIKLDLVPRVIFTHPQMAVVGEADIERDRQLLLSLSALGRYQVENKTNGFIKLFINTEHIIRKVIITSENAESLIGEGLVLVNNKNKIDDLTNFIHPHPTFSEAFSEIIK